MKLAALFRYPIKSLQGEEVAEAVISPSGVRGDRAMGFVDVATGRVVSAKRSKRYPGLFDCAAELLDADEGTDGAAAVRVRLPDGRAYEGADIAPAVSELVRRELALVAQTPDGAIYEMEWPEFGAMPDALERALRLGESEGSRSVVGLPLAPGKGAGAFVDLAPLHTLATSTLAQLAERHPDGDWDVRRFRPNLLIDDAAAPEGFAEHDWLGCDLVLGDGARLRAAMPTPRCVMTTLAQPGLAHDPGILRTIAEANKLEMPEMGSWACAGVYLEVVAAGPVRRGDEIRVVAGDVPGPDGIARAMEGFQAALAAS